MDVSFKGVPSHRTLPKNSYWFNVAFNALGISPRHGPQSQPPAGAMGFPVFYNYLSGEPLSLFTAQIESLLMFDPYQDTIKPHRQLELFSNQFDTRNVAKLHDSFKKFQ